MIGPAAGSPSSASESAESLQAAMGPRATAERNEVISRLAACHEASHAIAAYRLCFPYEAVSVLPPRDGRFDESAFQPDPIAYQIGLRYLDGRKASHRQAVVSVCTVWAIARHMHVRFNGLSVAEAEGLSTRDLTLATEFLRKQRLSDERRREIWGLANTDALAIVAQRGFRRALEAVSHQLRLEGSAASWAVRQTIESAVGEALQGRHRDPTSDEIALAAHFLHESRHGSDEVRDWLLAERGVRFGVACCAE